MLNLNGRIIPFNLVSEIKDYKPDIVLCCEFSLVNNLMLFYRSILKKHFKIITISEDNEYRIHRPGSLLRMLNRNLLCKFIDGIITLNITDVVKYYRKKVGKRKVIGITTTQEIEKNLWNNYQS